MNKQQLGEIVNGVKIIKNGSSRVECAESEAKFWIKPIVSLPIYYRLSPKKLNEIQKIAERRKDKIIKEWKKHFGKH